MYIKNPSMYNPNEDLEAGIDKVVISNDFITTTKTNITLNHNEKSEINHPSFDKQKSLESVVSTPSECERILKKEKWYSVTIQIFIPFMIAGMGTIAAGIVLGKVEDYEVFKQVNALYVLVPSLLGLKGNLDMCLASRLSTQANLGNMKAKKEIFKMVIGNIGLVQIQAIVASCIVSVFAVSTSAALNGNFQWIHAFLLTASSILTATLSCFALDFLLITIIFLSHKVKLNPDNLATPFAASVGDVLSLLVLSNIAKFLFQIHDTYTWLLFAIIGTYIFITLPIWILIVRKNDYTKKVLYRGWTPVIVALFISGAGGLVLDSAVDQFRGYVTFQPIINGIGGNLVSVQASRTSTMLHKTSIKGVIPPHTKQCVAPWTALFAGVFPAKTARILLILSIPGQAVFILVADVIANDGVLQAKYPFIISYLTVSFIQIMLLLYIAHIMVHTMWRLKMDPDNSAIPYLTALGDLSGSTFLLLAFIFLRSIHQEYAPNLTD